MADHTDEQGWRGHESRLSAVSEDALRTDEPENTHGGLQIQDFHRRSLWWSIRKAISLLPAGKRKWLFIGAAVQLALSFLDLIGIALIGLVASVAVSGIGLTSIPAPAQSAIDALGLGGLTVTQLSAALAASAVFVLVAKTLSSAALNRWIIHFLATQQAEVSTGLARGFLGLPLAKVSRWTTSEAIYALGSGVSAATTSLLSSGITIAAEVFLFTIVGITLLFYDPILTITVTAFFGVILAILQRSMRPYLLIGKPRSCIVETCTSTGIRGS